MSLCIGSDNSDGTGVLGGLIVGYVRERGKRGGGKINKYHFISYHASYYLVSYEVYI